MYRWKMFLREDVFWGHNLGNFYTCTTIQHFQFPFSPLSVLYSNHFIKYSQSVIAFRSYCFSPHVLAVADLEVTNFTMANPTKVLIECGIACNKDGSNCSALYVKGQECHLLLVGHHDMMT